LPRTCLADCDILARFVTKLTEDFLTVENEVRRGRDTNHIQCGLKSWNIMT
jgi:hypothetical protein